MAEEEEEAEEGQRTEEVEGKSWRSDASCRGGSRDGTKVVASEGEERRRVLEAGDQEV